MMFFNKPYILKNSEWLALEPMPDSRSQKYLKVILMKKMKNMKKNNLSSRLEYVGRIYLEKYLFYTNPIYSNQAYG